MFTAISMVVVVVVYVCVIQNTWYLIFCFVSFQVYLSSLVKIWFEGKTWLVGFKKDFHVSNLQVTI